MKLLLSQNIRIYRKKMLLTQEQLAEAMGISVATVSKWEGGTISPDVEMLAELADFFQVSVDVLLGYEWKKHSMGQCVDYIHNLYNERKYEEGAMEARKAIQKYPNSFQIMYESGEMLFMAAISRVDVMHRDNLQEIEEELEYAAKTLERALELFDQNTDKNISKESIHQHIGIIYGHMGDKNRAIEYLEEHNVCNINDRMIGIYLCELKDFERAWTYSVRSFTRSLVDTWVSYQGVYNVLINTGRYDEAIEISKWAKDFCMSVAAKERSYCERAAVMVDTMTATVYAYKEEVEKRAYTNEIRKYLRVSLLEAKHFDENPDYEGRIKFFRYEGEKIHDNFGETAFSIIKHIIRTCKQDGTPYNIMVRLYNELVVELELNRELIIGEE